MDWNIISYLKGDEYKDLRNYIAQVNNFFIFPYSMAHIQDLYQSKSPTNIVKFEQDLDTLTTICQTHLLNYDNNSDAPYPYHCLPRQFIEREELTLLTYASGFKSFNFIELLKSVIDANTIESIHKLLCTIPLEYPIINPNGIAIKTLWDAMTFALENLSLLLKDKKYEVEVYKSQCKIEGENNIQKMQKLESSDIFDYLNEICFSRTGKNLTDIILSTLEKINGKNSITYFLAEYTTLALSGYSRDKKRNILNIMTDALHAYYAMHCDVLVTMDDGMKKKANAEFFRYKSQTKIISINELQPFLESEMFKQYNLEYIQTEVFSQCSVGEERGEGKRAYKNIASPIFGLFNNCMKFTKEPDVLVLTVNINANGFIYFTELERFFKLVENFITDNQKQIFQREVVDKFLTRDKKIIQSIRQIFNFKNWQIELVADPESPVPLPMINIRKK